MRDIPPRRPVSQRMLALVSVAPGTLSAFPEITEVRRGSQAGTIELVTASGAIQCPVTQDDLFVYLEVDLPSGGNPCFLKRQLWLLYWQLMGLRFLRWLARIFQLR